MDLVRVDMIISKLFNLLPTQMSQNVVHEAHVVLDDCTFFTAVWSRFEVWKHNVTSVVHIKMYNQLFTFHKCKTPHKLCSTWKCTEDTST